MSDKVVTESRVTKTVIRRRAAPQPPPPPISTEPPPPPTPESHAPAETPGESKAPSIVSASPTARKKIDVETPAATHPGSTSSPVMQAAEEELKESTDPSYQAKYKRLKVVAAPPPPPPSEAKPARADRLSEATGLPDGILAAPGTSGLGRKEIIEIRDFHKPKMHGKMHGKKRLAPGKKGKKTEITTPRAIKRVIRITENITVADLAKKMSVKAGEVIQKLIGMGTMVTINQNLDMDTATLVASEFGFELENVKVAPEDLLVEPGKAGETDSPEDLKPRAPVVTVMGHVDHGKTSLLDSIRKTTVASGEVGGITQHIGAYTVKTDSGKMVTFIDTPGHEAFTAMRARGAKITDIVVLVVAADDGVMPQTKEAINHARSAKVPIIVAINKMDKPGVDPEKIKKALTEFNMVPEEWGGDTLYIPVSAKTGTGIPQLLEMLHLQTEVLELKANPNKRMRGAVIEARLDKRRGPIITVLVQEGTLHEGDYLVAGAESGRVRAMLDDKGNRLREAGPSTAVEILGVAGVPIAGDHVSAVADEKTSKQISEMRQMARRDQDLSKSSKVSLDDLYQKIEQGDVKELKLIIKADTTGSVEVLTDTLIKLATPKVAVRVIHGAVGGISENDVMLARASGALILGFHVRPDASAEKLAEHEKVEIRLYEIIYELTEQVTKAMTGLLAPQRVEKTMGRAEVRQIFSIPKAGTVAGCQVTDGKILRSAHVRLVRDSVPVYTGKLDSLRRFKDDVREVANGLECGIVIENFNDVKVGDVIEAFTVEEIAASLE